MRDWLNNLSQRERVMVIGCGVFIVLALVWTLGIRPLLALTSGLDERVAMKRGQLVSLQTLAARAAASENDDSTPRTGGNQSLVVIIDRTTRERQLAGYLKRNQPEGAGSVRLRFENAPFDALVSWLGDLDTRYGLKTTNANFDRSGPGRVNASIVLARSGV